LLAHFGRSDCFFVVQEAKLRTQGIRLTVARCLCRLGPLSALLRFDRFLFHGAIFVSESGAQFLHL
jgi:hypothetical protein